MSPSYSLKTLGCKANFHDTQVLEAELRKRGWVAAADGDESSADLCVVNSCTVTDEADRQSRKAAGRLSRDNPGAKVVFTGCGAEVDPQGLLGVRGVDYVVGNRDKSRLVDLVLGALGERPVPGQPAQAEAPRVLGVAENYAQMVSRHPMDREWPAVESVFHPLEKPAEGAAQTHRTRAFLKIQDGCNSFCTYCIIPYGRGPSRSLGIAEVVEQVREQVEAGVREVVITGINIGDYGVDWNGGKPALVELFEAILAETRLERLRVSSLDPVEIEDGLLSLMRREPRFCPHFHVSLQSPHAKVLRLMKRKYSAPDVEACLEKIARLPAPAGGAFVGMDVITGFPGEGDEEFEWTREQLARLPWSRLHVFPYSEREGTPATRLPGTVAPEVRAQRARVLRELSLARLQSIHRAALEHCRETGQVLEDVLMESPVRGPDGSMDWVAGYTRNYLRVLVRAEGDAAALANRTLRVRPDSMIVDANAGDCAFLGTWLKES